VTGLGCQNCLSVGTLRTASCRFEKAESAGVCVRDTHTCVVFGEQRKKSTVGDICGNAALVDLELLE